MTVGTTPPTPGNRFFFFSQGLVTAGTGFLLVNRQLVTGNQVRINSVLEEWWGDKSGTKENEREESDRFKECNKMLRSTPISHVKVTIFNYEHPPTTSFYHLYTAR